jgi:hypothetical protein
MGSDRARSVPRRAPLQVQLAVRNRPCRTDHTRGSLANAFRFSSAHCSASRRRSNRRPMTSSLSRRIWPPSRTTRVKAELATPRHVIVPEAPEKLVKRSAAVELIRRERGRRSPEHDTATRGWVGQRLGDVSPFCCRQNLRSSPAHMLFVAVRSLSTTRAADHSPDQGRRKERLRIAELNRRAKPPMTMRTVNLPKGLGQGHDEDSITYAVTGNRSVQRRMAS